MTRGLTGAFVASPWVVTVPPGIWKVTLQVSCSWAEGGAAGSRAVIVQAPPSWPTTLPDLRSSSRKTVTSPLLGSDVVMSVTERTPVAPKSMRKNGLNLTSKDRIEPFVSRCAVLVEDCAAAAPDQSAAAAPNVARVTSTAVIFLRMVTPQGI